jgi:hypothetical protein|tara:strand:+ start:545 stop:649 length:105 start_codon:yes stop_codon:yes gene_type:complete
MPFKKSGARKVKKAKAYGATTKAMRYKKTMKKKK